METQEPLNKPKVFVAVFIVWEISSLAIWVQALLLPALRRGIEAAVGEGQGTATLARPFRLVWGGGCNGGRVTSIKKIRRGQLPS